MVNEVRNSPIEERPILDHLATRELGRHLLVLEDCTSTIDVAAEHASREVIHGFTVISERQSEGRGRFGRVWVSPRGGIWMTVVLRPKSSGSFAALPILAALAVVSALQSRGVQALVRWPNDVMVNRKKVAGVLVESRSEGNTIAYALLGIGINANFHSAELKTHAMKATTLLEVAGSPVDRNTVICDILLSIERLLDDVFVGSEDTVVELLKENECSVGRKVRIETPEYNITGVFQDYQNLTKVLIGTSDQARESIETGSAVSVEYLDD
jgi:BirA family biotin operon repressor/biotin-[acetyl-CoA-carboxylase] ligase